MEKSELISEAKRIITANPNCQMATIGMDGYPSSRTMYTMLVEDPMEIFYCSFKGSRKCSQINANSKINCIWVNNENWETVELAGDAKIIEDLEIKAKLWNPMISKYFSGPEDPNYVILKITPKCFSVFEGMGESRGSVEF